MKPTEHILAMRFSALGDVAMTVPVLRLLLHQHSHLHITMVSEPFHAPLFEGIERLHFLPASTKKEYRGIKGLWKLSRQIKKQTSYSAIADLHNVLRTVVLRNFLRPAKIAVINKGRAEKKAVVDATEKNLLPLKTSFQRYADVFAALGYTVALKQEGSYAPKKYSRKWMPFDTTGKTLIGIAPFAKHAAKVYPMPKMKELVQTLSAEPGNQLVLFGSKAEREELQTLVIAPNVINMAGLFSFKEELQAISSLDIMVSMDSANMHLASMYGVPVVSIWGGTHPYLGFYGWGQDMDWAVQTDLPCRPSSVFGNKPCPVHGAAGCMQEITTSQIIDKVKKALSK